MSQGLIPKSKNSGGAAGPSETAMAKLIEQLTTTGKEDLEPKLLASLLEHALRSPENIRLCSDLIFCQMEIDHAQIRYSTLLVLSQLIDRSSQFQEIFFLDLDMLKTIVKLTVQGVTTKRSRESKATKLRPQFIALKLREKALEFIVSWNTNYSQIKHSRIPKILKFISRDLEMKLPNFPRTDGSCRRPEEISSKMALDIIETEFDNNEDEMKRTLEEIKTCFELLVPRFEQHEIPSNDDKIPCTSVSSVAVLISPNGLIHITRTDDNQDILDNLIGLYKLITIRFLPLIHRWINGSNFEEYPLLENRLESMKFKLEFEKSRYERLNIKAKNEVSSESESEEDDSDFEEIRSVPEWMEIPFLAMPSQITGETTVLSSGEGQGQISNEPISLSPSPPSCKAPLGQGKLCPRKDLEKCPFHGRIVPRDYKGIPIDPADLEVEAKRLEGAKVRQLDWQDPKHLKNLKAKTGMDLSVRKGKRHTFEERYPGLISLNSKELSSRQRLAKKITKTNPRKRQKLDTSITEAPIPY